MRKLIWPAIGFLCLALGLSLAVGWWAFGSALDRLEERGQGELSLASDRLLAQLQRFRQLAVVMASHPSMVALLREPSDQFSATAERILLRTADKTGAHEIFVVSAAGRKVASSRDGDVSGQFTGLSYFERAMYGALGSAQMQINEETGRAFYFAAPIKEDGQPPFGALVVKVSLEAVESNWRADPNVIFFTDRYGVVFVSNRSELLFGVQDELAAVKRNPAVARKYELDLLHGFPEFRESLFNGHQLWASDGAGLFPETAMHLVRPLPVVNLHGEILIDTAAARLTAFLQAGFAGAVSLIFGAAIFILYLRRASLAERLALEEGAKRDLEIQVQRRTEQLSGVNLDLRQQIRERREAEEALKIAQQDLVQAGKLSALGQMSAGISHELNQPLMAIRSFAENADVYLERGQIDTARDNLSRISELARRMGRIIKNLRAFARKEGEPMTEVNLNEVITAALELAEKRLEQDQVVLNWRPSAIPVLVRGGDVRLQQVLMNLLTNALDAMDGQSARRIDINVEHLGARVVLKVRDTGPGLSEPDKIFDPFYSTKAVGHSEGMGLGLSISYGIVQSFGGQITGRNHPDGGSEFSVELSTARQKDAA